MRSPGGLVTTHAENGDLIDSLVRKARANKQTAPLCIMLSLGLILLSPRPRRFLDLAYSGRHPAYIVHMSAESALDRVRLATLKTKSLC